jgi:hypothetical protein
MEKAHIHVHTHVLGLAVHDEHFPYGHKKARTDRAAGRSLFSIYLTWLQAAANDHDSAVSAH